jgi:hypothetical protein
MGEYTVLDLDAGVYVDMEGHVHEIPAFLENGEC